MRWVVQVVLVGLLLVQGTGNAAVLCAVKKSGVVKLRDTACKSKETHVDPVALGLLGPRGPQGATGPQGSMGVPGTARAYGEVSINMTTGDYELVPGSTKNVVGITQGGGGNSAACIQLDPSIDATTAIVIALPNLRSGGGSSFDTQVLYTRPFGYCGGAPANSIEIVTTQTDHPGAAVKLAFAFAVI